MIFSLGFLVAGLLTLVFLPAFWRRAVRLSTRRLEMQMPLSMSEIVAERDQLRAEFATEQRRIEQRAENAGEAHARDMSELGRRATRIAALDADVAAGIKDIAERDARLAEIGRELADVRAEHFVAAKDRYDTDTLLALRTDALRALDRQHMGLIEISDQQGSVISAQEAHIANLAEKIAAQQQDMAARAKNIADLERRLGDMGDARNALQVELAALSTRKESLQLDLQERHKLLEDIEAELRELRKSHARLATDIQSRDRQIADAGTREAELDTAMESLRAEHREAERATAGKLEVLRAEIAALHGALDVARAATRNSNGKSETDDSALLRRTISEVGGEVSRIAAALDEQTSRQQDNVSAADRLRALQSEPGRTAAN